MSKRLIIFIYVVAVLIFSGFLAEASPSREAVPVAKAGVNQMTGVLTMAGQLPNVCLGRPSVVINKIDQSTKAILVSVLAVNRSEGCSDLMGPQYQLSVDLKELPLVYGQAYSVLIANFAGTRTHIGYVAGSAAIADSVVSEGVAAVPVKVLVSNQ